MSIRQEATDGAQPPELGPLAGLRVLELGELLAGPFVGTLLGEFGAEVIKIERPRDGDILRRFGPMVGGKCLFWEVNARNKQSVVLDLKDAEGQMVLRDLLARSDVFVNSLRPGTLETWGLGQDELTRCFPRLVTVNVSAFGMIGPNRSRGGYDPIAQGFSGLSFVTGDREGAPMRAGGAIPVCDFMTGLAGAFAAIIALYDRDARRTGAGQTADLALYDVAFRMLGPLLSNFDLTGKVWQRDGNHSLGGAPTGHFKTKDGHWVCVSVQNDAQFRRLAHLLHRSDWLDDPLFSTLDERTRNRDRIEEVVTDWFLRHSRDDVMAAFGDAGLTVGVINSVADIARDDHLNGRSILWSDDPELGRYRAPAVVPSLSRTPGRVERRAPSLGQDSVAVLKHVLGYDAPKRQALIERGIVA